VKAIFQQRDQMTEHVRRSRETMKQKKGWMLGITGFPVEDFMSLDGGGAEMDHAVLQDRLNSGTLGQRRNAAKAACTSQVPLRAQAI
jgi:hypothetical protein